MSEAMEVHDFRHARIGELAQRVRRALRPAIAIIGIIIGAGVVYLFAEGEPGGIALLLIGIGGCFSLVVWCSKGAGLPLLPMIVLQHILVYGLPLVASRDSLSTYSDDLVTKAGVDVLFFFIALTAAWRSGMTAFTRAKAVCYAIHEFNRQGGRKMVRIGFSLIVVALAYQVVIRTGALASMLALLPTGIEPIFWAVISAAGVCGFFIVSLLLGGGSLSTSQKMAFWLILAGYCFIAASSFLLSSAALMIITVMVGLFWSSGKVPWIYLVVVFLLFSFLNVGKVTMRQRYWGDRGADEVQDFAMSQIPDIYAEWCEVSFDTISGSGIDVNRPRMAGEEAPVEQQTFLQRINNMQNLLFVIDAMDNHHIEPLYGKTYTIIPMLLIPRILWPEKPRTHEGQVLLNVHFNRQDLMSTESAYVAWGLLPEAYGNFGAILGAVLIGLVFGLVFAWIEQFTANKLVISVEGFVAFVIFLGMANSFEFVASVLVTSIFQSVIPVLMATAPFARRTVLKAPEAAKA